MRLFKSTNKSQASLEKHIGPRDQSPIHPDNAYSQTQPQAYNPSGAQYSSQVQQPQPSQSQVDERYYTEVTTQAHPTHSLGRTPSNRSPPAGGDAYVQDNPTVNIVPPQSDIPTVVQQQQQQQQQQQLHQQKSPQQQYQQQQQPQSSPQQQQQQQQRQQGYYNSAQPNYNQSPPPRPEPQQREHKRSKRSIFGLGSSKDKKEDKDNSAGDRRSGVGRTGSVLKRSGHQQQPQTSQTAQAQDPPREARLNAFVDESSTDQLPEESDNYEKYYRPVNQYESQQGQTRQTSGAYSETTSHLPPPPPPHVQQPRIQSQQPTNPIYQQPGGSAHNSDNYLPYQPSRQSTFDYERNVGLRPASQNSLGPPSPYTGEPQQDSRPSSSANQNRFSGPIASHPGPPQQLSQHPQEQAPGLSTHQEDQPRVQEPEQEQLQTERRVSETTMPRADNSNGGSRQHRDVRHDDQHMYQPQQDPRVRTQEHPQGRNTPPPRGREDPSTLDYHTLLQRHEELQGKYSKVKRYYFERENQVTQLQNTVANQRLSMSKTSLDDAQYSLRFERLNGAIQNLSFNIRKDWRQIPNWLTPVCNRDAHSIGTKEMTAVGRACITRWLNESIFDRVFHPGLDPHHSMFLKNIEKTLRRAQWAAPLTSDQQDDLVTKITTWRLTTIEGLSDHLNSRQAEAFTEETIRILSTDLTNYVRRFLVEPPPPGLFESLGTIVAQAIGIASNIPLESRDICIEYFMPGSHVNETYMRPEGGMTVLTQPGSAPAASDNFPSSHAGDEDEHSTSSSMTEQQQQQQIQGSQQSQDIEAQMREAVSKGTNPAAVGAGHQQHPVRHESISGNSVLGPNKSSISSKDSKKGGGFLGGFVNKKPAPAQVQGDPNNKDPNIGNNNGGLAPPSELAYNLQSLTGGSTEGKIRFAVFLAVEVRGSKLPGNKDTKDDTNSTTASTIGDKGVNNGDGTKQQGQSGQGPLPQPPSQQASGSSAGGPLSAGTGAVSSKKDINVLCKAPVYCFE